jgi:hypothetical protein
MAGKRKRSKPRKSKERKANDGVKRAMPRQKGFTSWC